MTGEVTARPLGGEVPAQSGETLRAQRAAWERRPLLRELYADWHRRIVEDLATVDGPTVELGCGIGTFKESLPEAIATDLVESPWADELVDAQELPYVDSSIGNLVMVDVLHHLPRPLRCIEEAERVLLPGGRLVLVEPFCSPVSGLVYRAFHHERLARRVDPFSGLPHTSDDPWDANIAIPTLIFWRHLDRFQSGHPSLRVVRRERFAWLLYPLSGGFTHRQLVPYPMRRPLRRLESLVPLSSLAAFRCLVTLEKR